jgi:hypothetical protein
MEERILGVGGGGAVHGEETARDLPTLPQVRTMFAHTGWNLVILCFCLVRW